MQPSNICLNCNQPVSGNYCANCSQKTNVSRFTWRSFLAESLHVFTHMENTFLRTLWLMLVKPGLILDEYLGGKRKKYQSPVGLFLICYTAQIIVHRLWLHVYGFNPKLMPGVTFSDAASVQAYIEHMELFLLFCFPITASLLYLVLTRRLYTFLETVIITIYAYSASCAIWFTSYVVGGFLLRFDVMSWQYYIFTICISLAYTFWVPFNLLYGKQVRYFWPRVLIFPLINIFVSMRFLRFVSEMWVHLIQ